MKWLYNDGTPCGDSYISSDKTCRVGTGTGTDSAEFKAWFGKSVIGDMNGNPTVLYHATAKDFTEFKPSDSGAFGPGIYLSDTTKDANRWASRASDGGEGASIMPVYVSMSNPYFWQSDEMRHPDIVNREARRNGHDGIIREWATGEREVVAFYPHQIKSVFNRGTWSRTDPHISNCGLLTGGRWVSNSDGDGVPCGESWISADKTCRVGETIEAYHGTQHEVARFAIDKIGTGEGAQVFGYGLYFAQNKAVAEEYRKSLSGAGKLTFKGRTLVDYNWNPAADRWLTAVNGWTNDGKNLDDAIAEARKEAAKEGRTKEFDAVLKTARPHLGVRDTIGNTYTVKILANQSDLLDYDKPLKDQSPKLRKVLEEAIPERLLKLDGVPAREYMEKNMSEFPLLFRIKAVRALETNTTPVAAWKAIESGFKQSSQRNQDVMKAVWDKTMSVGMSYDYTLREDRTGQAAYEFLASKLGSEKAASEYLSKHGIKGIRYLDEGSRNLKPQQRNGYWTTVNQSTHKFQGKWWSEEEAAEGLKEYQTHNYVIFNDRDIEITHRNGKRVTAREAVGGSAKANELGTAMCVLVDIVIDGKSSRGCICGPREQLNANEQFANIDFDKPTPFKEAVKYVDDKKLLPTTLSSDELMQLSPAIREKAMFSAKTNNAWYLQQIKNKIDLIVGPEDAGGKPWRGMDAGSARAQLKAALKKIGYKPDQRTKGTIQDLSSDARLNLIVSTQTDMAHGFGQRMKALRPAVLDQWPAYEFVREEERVEPRDWPARWEEAGGEFYDGQSDYPEGRMVALKTDPIWEAISAFGLPYPPFDFQSGMGLREVSREECVELGLITEDEEVVPEEEDGVSESDYLDTIKSTTSEFDPEILDDLLEDLGEGYAVVKGILQMIANSQECGASWISDDKTCRVGIPTVAEAEQQLEDAKNNFRRIAKEEETTSGPKADAAYEKVIAGRRMVQIAKLNRDRPGAVILTREIQDSMLQELQDMNGGVDKHGFAKYKWNRGEFIKELDSIGKMYKAVPTGPAIVYRGVTSQDWERMQKQGFLDSDRRGAISMDEGMNLATTASTSAYYIPEGEEGVVLAIDASKSNLFKIEADEYLRTYDKIPLDRVLKHSGIIGNHPDAGGYYYPNKMSANEGQPCGDSFISSDKTCRVGSGNSSTDTPEFKEWFGSSKVVDKDGKPLRVYHGTDSDFTEFSDSKLGSSTSALTANLGHFFTDNKYAASPFALKYGGNIKPVYLRLQNPLEIGYRSQFERIRKTLDPFDALHSAIAKVAGKKTWTEVTKEDVASWKQKVESMGFDGIKIANTSMDSHGGYTARSREEPYHDFYIAFSPTQIKSVFNRGTWSKVDADIGNEQNAGLSTTH